MLLGNMYRLGAGVDRDEKEAIRWMREAADKDLPDAQHLLRHDVQERPGSGEEPSRAAALVRKAAAKDNSASQANLAHMYEKGLGVEKDYREAVRLYRLAAKKHDTMERSRTWGSCT